MKLKYFGAITAASVLLSGAAANAGALFDPYFGVTVAVGGATVFANDIDVSHSAQSYGAVVGIDIPVFRFELEYDYMHADSIKMHLGMINAYAKMPLPAVKPYIGIGIGNIFSGEDAGFIDIDSVAAYQAMLGVTFDIPVLPIDVDIVGRALYAADIYDYMGLKPDFLQYEARLKIRYVF